MQMAAIIISAAVVSPLLIAAVILGGRISGIAPVLLIMAARVLAGMTSLEMLDALALAAAIIIIAVRRTGRRS